MKHKLQNSKSYSKKVKNDGILEIEISPVLIEKIKEQYGIENVDSNTAELFIKDMLASAIKKAEASQE